MERKRGEGGFDGDTELHAVSTYGYSLGGWILPDVQSIYSEHRDCTTRSFNSSTGTSSTGHTSR